MDSITEIRKSLGLSQKDLAAALGITQSTLCRQEKLIEHDKRLLYAVRYLRLRQIIDADPKLKKKFDKLLSE